MKCFVSAGEASGDLHGSRIITALRKASPGLQVAVMGGPLMRKAAQQCVCQSEEVAYMGFIDVALHLNDIRKAARKVQQYLLHERPNVVVCIDYPGFHLRYVLPFVRKHLPNTRIVYYIPPKVWAWKKQRIRTLRQQTDLVLCIFPFEVPFFQQHHLPQAVYVGNPSVAEVEQYLQSAPPPTQTPPTLALVCGSRTAEIKANLPLMLRIAAAFPTYKAVIPMAPGLSQTLYAQIPGIEQAEIVEGDTYGVIRNASAALVTSGTATLETALLGTPQVVCYAVKGGKLANFVFRHFFHIPYISLVNLNAGKEVVQELYGGLFRYNTVYQALHQLLVPQTNNSTRNKMLKQYKELQQQLHTTLPAEQVAAQQILALLKR